MPLFLFHFIEGGELLLDREGQDCSDLAEARAHAVLELRAMISDEIKHGRLRLDDAILVDDELGDEVMYLTFANVVEIIGAIPTALPAREQRL